MSSAISSRHGAPSKAMFIFSVKDSGPGISEEGKKLLFKNYSQLQPKQSSSSGLGLALAKEFVTVLAGSIWVLRD